MFVSFSMIMSKKFDHQIFMGFICNNQLRCSHIINRYIYCHKDINYNLKTLTLKYLLIILAVAVLKPKEW
jgi:branched-subunit amino acid transport protein AzlD